MTGPVTPQTIELFVALLGVAAVVATVARPLRLPYTSHSSSAGASARSPARSV